MCKLCTAFYWNLVPVQSVLLTVSLNKPFTWLYTIFASRLLMYRRHTIFNLCWVVCIKRLVSVTSSTHFQATDWRCSLVQYHFWPSSWDFVQHVSSPTAQREEKGQGPTVKNHMHSDRYLMLLFTDFMTLLCIAEFWNPIFYKLQVSFHLCLHSHYMGILTL